MADFNATTTKLGNRNGDELRVEQFEYGGRMEREGLYMINTIIKKRECCTCEFYKERCRMVL